MSRHWTLARGKILQRAGLIAVGTRVAAFIQHLLLASELLELLAARPLSAPGFL